MSTVASNPRLTFTVDNGPRCAHLVTIGSSTFICRGPKGHPTDPTKGYAGSGHTLVGMGSH